MKYLIDTQVLLWVKEDSPKLSAKARSIIADKSNPIYVSTASFWEIAIKLRKGRLKLDGGLTEIERLSDENDYVSLPVKRKHLYALKDMPFHHKDPFDRLLVSTALVENMTLITNDEHISKYNVEVLW